MEYAERLSVPLRWWVQGTMFVVSVWLAFAVVDSLSGTALAVITLIFAAAVSAFMIGIGATRIEVTNGELRAGRAHIPLDLLGEVEALDAEHTRRVAGVDADARAYLVLRPYLKRSIKVQVNDPADPTPYWLIATRHPQRLAQAIGSAAHRTDVSH